MDTARKWSEWLVAILAITVIIAVPSCGYQFVTTGWQKVRIAFADEQTALFDEMFEHVREALNQTPPDYVAAADALHSLHNYYESGSKQISGSRLDKIVERHRTSCEREVFTLLRESTSADHGDRASDWIDWLRQFDE